MKITTIGSFQSVVNKINKKEKDMSDFLLDTAHLLNSKIQRRVQSNGLGSKGTSLKRYSRSYADRRQKFGRQSSFRDLTWTGTMWQSLTAVKTGTNKVEMFFGGSVEKAKAFYNDQKTPFFSLSPSEELFVQRQLGDFAKL